MKIMVGVLCHQLNSETVKSIFQMDWIDSNGFDVVFMWGNDIRRGETRFQAVTRKYGDLQRHFLASGHSALLTVEQDMLIPSNALQRLSRLVKDGADVAYGTYVWRYEDHHRWSAHPRLRLSEDESTPYFWSMTHEPEQARRLWGQPVQVEGVGLGCTLIPRHTLARLPFRQRKDGHSCDTALALDCQDEGLIQIADLGVIAGHYMDDGRTIWPDPNTDTLYRIQEAT